MQTTNILTIDVEDYFQVENFKKIINFSDWDKYEKRVAENSEKILKILDKFKTKATFFVLGWVAQRYPELVRKIEQAGHEVASHGYAHQLIYTQSPEEFRMDIRKAKIILEEIIQRPILGYRAPTYSVTKKSLWALNILMEEGFQYDSSFFPVHRDYGGLAQAKRHPHKIYNPNCFLWEFPLSTIRILKQNIPFSGGGYFRLLPYKFIKWAIRNTNLADFPAIIYLHPWELDPQQPRIKANYLKKFRHYVNISTTEKKLNQLLNDFKFKPIRDFLAQTNKGEISYEKV